jgi:hypothetical protein
MNKKHEQAGQATIDDLGKTPWMHLATLDMVALNRVMDARPVDEAGPWFKLSADIFAEYMLKLGEED